jgi:hypothetical protein
LKQTGPLTSSPRTDLPLCSLAVRRKAADSLGRCDHLDGTPRAVCQSTALRALRCVTLILRSTVRPPRSFR